MKQKPALAMTFMAKAHPEGTMDSRLTTTPLIQNEFLP
jgi:hypothetical protein